MIISIAITIVNNISGSANIGSMSDLESWRIDARLVGWLLSRLYESCPTDALM
jgi:hypothetical protein